MSRQHHIENWQFAQLRTRLADQLAQFHPQLRKTLLRNLSELVAAVTLARNVQLSAIGAKLPVDNHARSPRTMGAPTVEQRYPRDVGTLPAPGPRACWRALPGAVSG